MDDNITPGFVPYASASTDQPLAGHPVTDTLFTLQQKAYLMTILGLREGKVAPEEHTNAPTEATPATIQKRIESIMNDIRTPTHSRDNNQNYTVSNPCSEAY